MTEHIECAVIGAGVVGLAVARQLAMSGREVVVLEAENAFGTHTSFYGIESPGLTSSLAIADYAVSVLRG